MPPVPSRSYRLTKSRYIKGLICRKALWLLEHDPGRAGLRPPARERILNQGTEVGLLATERFPGGVFVQAAPQERERALAETRRALASEAPAVFEAAFLYHETFVRVDVLRRAAGGAWDLIGGQVHHQSEGRAPSGCGGAALRGRGRRPARGRGVPHAPEPRLHFPGSVGPVHPGGPGGAGRGDPGAGGRGAGRVPATAGAARGAARAGGPAVHHALRVRVQGLLLAPGAGGLGVQRAAVEVRV